VKVELKTIQVRKGPACYENWKASLKGAPVRAEFEYPLYSDAHIVGHDLVEGVGPYQILNCVNWRNRQRPTLVLCTRHYLTYDPEVKIKTEDDTYHGGYLQDEIAALISLMIGIRLKAGEANREFGPGDQRGRPISYVVFSTDPIVPPIHDRPILPSATQDHQLSDASLLSSLLSLVPGDVVALIRAARMYQEAVWIIESTPELSWLMLTSAVETVASAWRPKVETPEESLRTSRPKLVAILDEHGGNDLILKVANELVGTIGATRNFIDFLLRFLPPAPSPRSHEWAQHAWDQRKMKKSLGIIYRHRSRALHGGTPFPAPMSFAPMSVAENPAPAERPLGLASSTRGATWAAKDMPMLLHVFEYIVRNAILNWWRSLITTDEGAAHSNA
jgi:hypothetical protein